MKNLVITAFNVIDLEPAHEFEAINASVHGD